MNVPIEILQYIYSHLSTSDFNAARHTCRLWFTASLNRKLLVDMLKQAGWWSSILRIITPMGLARSPGISQERVMSKWIARECNLANPNGNAFVQVGKTDFRGLVSSRRRNQLHGDVSFTVSLCGRYLIATLDQLAYIYELNHVCQPGRSAWSIPLRRRQGMPLGFMRPVASIICPRRILCSSMDTSSGRHSVAFLMEGRVGMVCEITSNGQPASTFSPVTLAGPSMAGSAPNSRGNSPTDTGKTCICHERSPHEPPLVEIGERSVYRNICQADDPPRSVAICPQRNCVAFGCASGIELHWVDALTGQDLSRWFPLSSSSDFLYFLPARRGTDTAKKLRLISSAAGLLNPLDPMTSSYSDFRTTIIGSERTDTTSFWSNRETGLEGQQTADERPGLSMRPMCIRSRVYREGQISDGGAIRTVSARSADHYRAVPLSDGYHILFTDPRTGCLCLGIDAPIGSVTRLLRKVWFRPPLRTVSAIPILYAAGSDTRHGVRVVATFAFAATSPADATDNAPDKQMIAFFTVPPDLFHDLSYGNAMLQQNMSTLNGGRAQRQSTSEPWQPEESYGAIDVFSEAFRDSPSYPLEICGQVIAICDSVTEIALDSSPEMVV
ncbi:cefP protein [Pochonia chlamydosporia 170]|uniref:CefP protein n=1 Tax=Pochonia chlamydosporia 170 TaxID=1380566 RepID=A0A179FUH8_METCM|nr:cefP protein [Pochonia chlamydosporia 170]OAQ68733.1 cefP protein [Pochonia chlamydosporia 170]